MDYDKKLMESYKRSLRQGGGGNAPVICPTTYEKPCKLCDLCYEILKDRSLKGTTLSNKASELNQKHKYYSNVVFPAINPSQVVVMEYGDKIFKKLIGYHMDPTGQTELKLFMDPMKGRNLFIKKTPGTAKDRTDYDVEPSMSASPLADINVLKDLQPLDNIIALMKSGEVKVITQSKLEAGRTEIRILPSWLGPKSNMFFFPVNYHYGVTEEEFNAITAGELNPFATYKEMAPADPTPISQNPVKTGGWDEMLAPKAQSLVLNTKPAQSDLVLHKEEPKPESSYKECFGAYGSRMDECEGECVEEGWAGPCKMMSTAKADKERRAAARRLSK